MSVINQMLRDLDERQASERERAGLPPRLRTLPPAAVRRAQSWRMLAAGIVIGALAAGLGVAWVMSSVGAPAPVVAEAAPPPPRAILDAPIDMKISALPTHPVETAAPPPDPLPAPAPAPAAMPAKPKPAPPAAPPAPRQTQLAPVAPAKPAAPVAPVAKPEETIGADARIDRTPRGGQARELAEAEFRKGMQAVRRGDGATALPLLRKALEFDPALGSARQALLSVLVGNRQWDEARRVAQEGLALDPRQSGWAVILARLQLEQGDAAAAVTTLENHAVHAGNDADYQSLFAYLLQKQERPAEAAQRFQTAVALRPGEGRWWFGLASALEILGKSDEAKEAYARARATGNLPAEMAALADQKLKATP